MPGGMFKVYKPSDAMLAGMGHFRQPERDAAAASASRYSTSAAPDVFAQTSFALRAEPDDVFNLASTQHQTRSRAPAFAQTLRAEPSALAGTSFSRTEAPASLAGSSFAAAATSLSETVPASLAGSSFAATSLSGTAPAGSLGLGAPGPPPPFSEQVATRPKPRKPPSFAALLEHEHEHDAAEADGFDAAFAASLADRLCDLPEPKARVRRSAPPARPAPAPVPKWTLPQSVPSSPADARLARMPRSRSTGGLSSAGRSIATGYMQLATGLTAKPAARPAPEFCRVPDSYARRPRIKEDGIPRSASAPDSLAEQQSRVAEKFARMGVYQGAHPPRERQARTRDAELEGIKRQSEEAETRVAALRKLLQEKPSVQRRLRAMQAVAV